MSVPSRRPATCMLLGSVRADIVWHAAYSPTHNVAPVVLSITCHRARVRNSPYAEDDSRIRILTRLDYWNFGLRLGPDHPSSWFRSKPEQVKPYQPSFRIALKLGVRPAEYSRHSWVMSNLMNGNRSAASFSAGLFEPKLICGFGTARTTDFWARG
jgi:hypothetical protein